MFFTLCRRSTYGWTWILNQTFFVILVVSKYANEERLSSKVKTEAVFAKVLNLRLSSPVDSSHPQTVRATAQKFHGRRYNQEATKSDYNNAVFKTNLWK